MTHVVYQGPANFREFSKSDMGGLIEGYDGSKLRFERDVPQDVDSSIADALLNHDDVAGEFKEPSAKQAEELNEDDEEDDEPAKTKKKAAKKSAAAKKAAQTGSADSPGASSETSGQTGAGTSTAGSTT